MSAPNVRLAFRLFHLTLGLGLLVSTIPTILHALHEHGGVNLHLGIVIGLESVGAVLFLIPRTLRVGGLLLLVLLLGGFAVHVSRGEWEVQLLIYAAGVWYVMAHGAEWGGRSQGADTTARPL